MFDSSFREWAAILSPSHLKFKTGYLLPELFSVGEQGSVATVRSVCRCYLCSPVTGCLRLNAVSALDSHFVIPKESQAKIKCLMVAHCLLNIFRLLII